MLPVLLPTELLSIVAGVFRTMPLCFWPNFFVGTSMQVERDSVIPSIVPSIELVPVATMLVLICT